MYIAELVVAGVIQGLVVSLAALAITLVFGVARFPNVATGDMMTAGAYTGFVVFGITGAAVVSGAVAVLLTASLALTMHLLVFRKLQGRSVEALLVTSVGVAFLVRACIGLIFGHQQHTFDFPVERPIRIGDIAVQTADLRTGLVAVASLAICFIVLYRTPVGARMRAVADNPDLARVSGISKSASMVALWLLAGGVMGISGLMLGMRTVVSPEMGWDILLPGLAAAILGGIGSPVGALLGGLLMGVVQEVATSFVGFTYKIAIAFFVMLLVLLVRPDGLLGRREGER